MGAKAQRSLSAASAAAVVLASALVARAQELTNLDEAVAAARADHRLEGRVGPAVARAAQYALRDAPEGLLGATFQVAQVGGVAPIEVGKVVADRFTDDESPVALSLLAGLDPEVVTAVAKARPQLRATIEGQIRGEPSAPAQAAVRVFVWTTSTVALLDALRSWDTPATVATALAALCHHEPRAATAFRPVLHGSVAPGVEVAFQAGLRLIATRHPALMAGVISSLEGEHFPELDRARLIVCARGAEEADRPRVQAIVRRVVLRERGGAAVVAAVGSLWELGVTDPDVAKRLTVLVSLGESDVQQAALGEVVRHVPRGGDPLLRRDAALAVETALERVEDPDVLAAAIHCGRRLELASLRESLWGFTDSTEAAVRDAAYLAVPVFFPADRATIDRLLAALANPAAAEPAWQALTRLTGVKIARERRDLWARWRRLHTFEEPGPERP